jgi:hypothetical protein
MESTALPAGGVCLVPIMTWSADGFGRWIFIVEGVVTAGLGLLSYMAMSDYPHTAAWLTDREKEIIALTNEADRALLPDEVFDRRQIASAFTDWRTYAWGLVYLSVSFRFPLHHPSSQKKTYIPVYSVILSLPSVVGGLGYKGTEATLMACPPYAFGFVIVLVAGYTTDRFGHRYWHYVAGIVMTMIPLVVLMTVKDLKTRYGMFFLIMFVASSPLLALHTD